MDTSHLRLFFLLLLLLAIPLACASPRGTAQGGGWKSDVQLYPNDHYRQVGMEVAEMDVATCKVMADRQVGNASTAGTVAKNTVGGAALGAALGAVGGAIVGSPGTGAAMGAAVGGTGGLAKGAMDSRKNDPTYQGYVEACLREKGYQPIGWK
jgi:hypothetical protein